MNGSRRIGLGVLLPGLGMTLCIGVASGGKGGKPPPDPIDAAFAYLSGDHDRGHVMLSNADGSQTAMVYDGGGAAWASHAVLSPDGTKVAFMAPVSQNIWLMTVNTDGTELTQVFDVDDAGWVWHGLDWLPDGTKIGFGHLDDIYVINPDGTGLINVTGDALSAMKPSWSSDNFRLVVYAGGPIQARVLDLDANYQVIAQTPITDIPGSPIGLAFTPRWAKTSDQVVVEYDHDLWIIDVNDPTNPTNVTSTPDIDEQGGSFTSTDDALLFYTLARVKKKVRYTIWSLDPATGARSMLVGSDRSNAVLPRYKR